MTVFCERDTTRDGNHCVKCGGTWVAGTPLPACGTMNAPGEHHTAKEIVDDVQERLNEKSTIATLQPLDGRTLTKDEIIEADGATQAWRVPSAILLDPVIRDLTRDEPFFVLRGSDLLADYLVEQWARNAESNGCDPKRVRAAREKAQEFRAFSPRGYPK